MIIDLATAPADHGPDGARTAYLSNAGGLTQFGAYLDRLAPGAASSDRHWHTAEDEFLFMLDGIATVVDDDGAHEIGPGDAAAWRHGDPNGHHVQNRSAAPLTFLIIGSRAHGDICHYPDSGRRQVNGAADWQLLAADGTRLRGGALPPHLCNLAPAWGTAYDPARPAARILRKDSVRLDPGAPEAVARLGQYSARLYSDVGGLTQFGAFTETLAPGARSSDRHWHAAEDEFLYLVAGEATVIEDDGPHLLTPGDAACWKAGVANGHQVINRSDRPCTCLIAGTRAASDRVHYSDIDKICIRETAPSPAPAATAARPDHDHLLFL